jgi:aquaporin Z
MATHLLGSKLRRPEVHYAATYPGPLGAALAVAGEFVISFVLMSMVLHISSHPKFKRFTGIFAGLLVAAYIAFESLYSGMSMNPAGTFTSALPSGIWSGFWIYLVVPPLAMLAAAELYTRTGPGRQVMCCKMYHNPHKDCAFCGRKGDDQ